MELLFLFVDLLLLFLLFSLQKVCNVTIAGNQTVIVPLLNTLEENITSFFFFQFYNIFRSRHTIFYSTYTTYPALLLTAVRLFTPVFNRLLIRFSGMPHKPKPVNTQLKNTF